MRNKRVVGYRGFDRRLGMEPLESRLALCSLAALAEPLQQPESFPAAILSAATAEAEGESVSPLDSDPGRASQAVNQFAFDLYRHFQREQGNLFLSPLSISMALAMTSAGARGGTAEEMANVLRLGSEPGIHESYRELYESLNAGDRRFELAIANALWPQVGFPFKDEFLQLIAANYGSSSQALDFAADPEGAKDVINSWVAEQTHDKIKDLIQELADNVRMVLTNAIYFKGDWAREFDPANTLARPFHLGSGDALDVPMMSQTSEFRYKAQDGFQVLDMPYQGNELSMVLLLPEAGSTTDELSADTLAKVSTWLDGVPPTREVIVTLPKFKMTVSSGLNEVLIGMGMPTAFDDQAADFSGMANDRLYISDVLHKAFVEVNEEGTEAAAATAVVIRPTSACFGCFDPPPIYFTADHPFHFFIRDNTTSTILFLGRVSDPTQEENDIAPEAEAREPPPGAENPLLDSALDENHDGHITPIDVLLIINHIDAATKAVAAFTAAAPSPFDNNDDGFVSALDVLIVVNWINVEAGVYTMSPTDSPLDQSDAIENDEALLDLLQGDEAELPWYNTPLPA